MLADPRAQVLDARERLGELARLGVVSVAKGFECAFGRGERFLRGVVSGLEMGECSVFLVAVIGKIFGFFDELLGGAVSLVFGELQLLCERIEFELYACLVIRRSTRKDKRTLVDDSAERSSLSWVSRLCWSCLACLRLVRRVWISSSECLLASERNHR